VLAKDVAPRRDSSASRGQSLLRSLAVSPLEQALTMLVTERDRLNRAIEALQGPTKRRGRPPKNAIAVTPTPAKTRRPMSAANRKAQGERMKAYWAARKKADAKAAKG
jgi:hypothetical protein